MFLCRMNPAAFRVRPSQGDGGIDVCVPTGVNRFEVYQVKKFASNLTSSQKTQVEKSHARLRDFAGERGWTIDNWYLTLPLDPTTENLSWLAEIAATGPFPCDWRGLSHVDGWASNYKDVVDYYFNDGRERLMEDLARFTAISGIPMSPGVLPSVESFPTLAPSDVLNGLVRLRETLNARDPHYSYDFSVSGQPPPRPVSGDYPSTLAARTAQQVGDSYVTFDVHARCAESLKERPIKVTMTWMAQRGSVEHRELEEFFTYGRTPEHPIQARDVTVEMPGGLGGESALAQVLMSEAGEPGEPFERRLSILSPEDEVLATIELTMYPPVSNHDGTGQSNRGRDRSGFFELETLVLAGPPKQMTLRLRTEDPVGLRPDQLEPALAVVDSFRLPNQIRLEATRGPARSTTHPVPASDASDDSRATNRALLAYVRALIVIQRHTPVELKFPEFERLSELNIAEATATAKLLNGETLKRTWNTLQFHLNPEAAATDEPRLFVADQVPLSFNVGGDHIELGRVRHIFESARIVSTEAAEDGQLLATLQPGPGNDTVLSAWHGEASIDH